MSRGTETEESLAARVNKASYELSFKDQFDRHILNEDLEKACAEARNIVEAFIAR
jgi:guanylate kinase